MGDVKLNKVIIVGEVESCFEEKIVVEGRKKQVFYTVRIEKIEVRLIDEKFVEEIAELIKIGSVCGIEGMVSVDCQGQTFILGHKFVLMQK